MKYNLFFAFAMHTLQEGILGLNVQLERCWIVDSIGPHYFVMHTCFVELASNAKEQEPFRVGMRCLSNPYYFVRFLMFGV